MKLTFEFEPGQHRVTVRLSGELTLSSARAAYEALLRHPDFRAGMNAIWDLRQTTVRMPPGDPSKLVEHVRSRRSARGSRFRTAIIALTSEQWSIARMFELLSAPLSWEYAIFGNERAAQLWQQSAFGEGFGSPPVVAALRDLGSALSLPGGPATWGCSSASDTGTARRGPETAPVH